jgi:hypothetical protein
MELQDIAPLDELADDVRKCVDVQAKYDEVGPAREAQIYERFDGGELVGLRSLTSARKAEAIVAVTGAQSYADIAGWFLAGGSLSAEIENLGERTEILVLREVFDGLV